MHVRSCLVTIGLLAAPALAGAQPPPTPITVSPGEIDRPSAVDRCPTFHWGVAREVDSFDLAVLAVPAPGDESAGDPSYREVARRAFPGAARGWTPDLAGCLAPGRYAWTLRARTGGAGGDWSEPRLIEVAAAPGAQELAEALAMVRAYLETQGVAEPATQPFTAIGDPVRTAGALELGSPDPALLSAPDATGMDVTPSPTTGVVFGVRATSASSGAGSAGVAARSTAGSGDVAGLHAQVESAAGSAGVFDNTAGGDVLRGLVNGAEMFRVEGDGDVVAASFTGDGSGLTGIAADDVDCAGCVSESELDFDPATQAEVDAHTHPGDDIVGGTVDEAEIDAALARDTEVMGIVLGSDGPGSALDADLLDGNDSAAFMPAATDNWVDEAGDTMSGSLSMGGHQITEVSALTRTGAANDLTVSSGRHIVLDAPSGDIQLNAADSTIHLNAPAEVAGTLEVTEDDAATAVSTEVATLAHTTTGIAGAGIGAGLGFAAEDDAGNPEPAARIEGVLTDAGDSTETSALRFFTRTAGGALAQAAALDGAGDLTVAGDAAATSFTGDGSGLTGVAADSAATAAALAANGANCAAGEAPLGVDAAGAAEGCFDVATQTELSNHAASGDHDAAYVNVGGDAMSGDLDIGGNDLVGVNTIRKGGNLLLHAPGTENLGVGTSALASSTTGSRNVAAGRGALRNNSSGTSNVAVGANALYDNTAAGGNIAIGDGALRYNAAGYNNLGAGYHALFSNTSGIKNIALGSGALHDNTTGSRNTALGEGTLRYSTTASGNTAAGYHALFDTTTGYDNTAIGDRALRDNSGGSFNTAVGKYALAANIGGASNTALGLQTLAANTSGARNTALGVYAMTSNTTGSYNTAAGQLALASLGSGTRNVALGYKAGYNVTGGDDGIFILSQGLAADTQKIRVGTQGTQTAAYVAGIYPNALAGSPVVVTAAGRLGIAAGATGDADTLDGVDSTQLLRSDTSDSFTSGTLTFDAGTTLDVDGALALPAAGISGAGSGSGLDADLLDGNHASAFLLASTDNWVDEAGDTMSGDLDLGGNDLVGVGTLQKGGNLLLHTPGTDNVGLGENALAAGTTGVNNTAGGSEALYANTTGNDNTALGADALHANTSGNYNTALGRETLRDNVDTGANTAVGHKALRVATASHNTALGHQALLAGTTGPFNTAVGSWALKDNTTGEQNTAVGQIAMQGNTTGSRNTAIGRGALDSALGGLGDDNVAIGWLAGSSASGGGSDNLFIAHAGVAGDSAKIRIGTQGTQTAAYVAGIYPNALAGSPVVVTPSGRLGIAAGATGDADTLDGVDSTQLLRSDTSDSFISGTLTFDAGTTLDVDGALALPAAAISGAGSGSGLDADLLDGNDSTAFMPAATDNWVDEAGDTMSGNLDLGGNRLLQGVQSFLHSQGTKNLAAGARALDNNTTGTYATAVGHSALYLNTIGNFNTAVGGYALKLNQTGYGNTAIGAAAMEINSSGNLNVALGGNALVNNTVGDGNTAVGYNAMRNNTASRNTALGFRALFANTTGDENTAVGSYALESSTSTGANTAIGYKALQANTSAISNTAIGHRALAATTTGPRNTAIGQAALQGNTSGYDNTALGQLSLSSNVSGVRNTAVGRSALNAASGSDNVALGAYAGTAVTTGSNNVLIAHAGVAGDSAKIRVGTQGTQTAAYVAGIYPNALAGSPVVVTPSGQLGIAAGATGDADTLDGLDSTQLLRSDTSGSLAGALDVADDLTVGSAAETLANAGFTLDGDDLFVAGSAGVKGTIYTDAGLTVGASTVFADGSITQTTAGAGLTVDVAGGDAAGENLVVSAHRVGINAATPARELDVASRSFFHHSSVAAPSGDPFFGIEADLYSEGSGLVRVVDRRQQTALSRTPTLVVENSHASTLGSNPLIQARAAGSIRFVVQQDGKVGILDADPSEALEIGGNVKVSGYVQLGVVSVAPPPGDCDDASEHGRATFDPTSEILYLCAVSGWVGK